jgi:hypothetical protein
MSFIDTSWGTQYGRKHELKGAVGRSLHGEAKRPDFAGNAIGIKFAPLGFKGRSKMSLGTILLILLVLLLLGALPTWPYSGGWGYYPSGGLGLVLIVLLVLVFTGRL